jgi:hypothetical protein
MESARGYSQNLLEVNPNMRIKSTKVECEGWRACEFSNKCTPRPPRLIPRGLFIGRLRRSINIVWTIPNRPGSQSEYIVMGLLQSFVIYKHFYSGPIIGWHVSHGTTSSRSNLPRKWSPQRRWGLRRCPRRYVAFSPPMMLTSISMKPLVLPSSLRSLLSADDADQPWPSSLA